MKTREQWLQESLEMMRKDLFTDEVMQGEDYPEVHVSTGNCNGSRGSKLKTLGVCYDAKVSEDKKAHIIIDFQVNDSMRVLDILAHEMVHAVLGAEAGHGPKFKRLATAIGLEGKMTATVAGDKLKEKLASIIDLLGDYPHPKVTLTGGKKQTTRMIKVECENTGYVARMSRKWLEEHGAPICPCCHNIMEVA